MTAGGGIFAGENKTLRIERYSGSAQPIGVGFGADKQKQVPDWPAHFLAVCAYAPADCFEDAVTPFQTADDCTGDNFYIGEAAHAINQVTRHRLAEVAAGQHRDFDTLARQENDSLTGRISCADQ